MRSLSLLGLLVVVLVLVFGLRSALQSSSGGVSHSSATLDGNDIAQAQAICQRTFTPPLVRFPAGSDDDALQAAAQQAGATLQPMLSQLQPAITAGNDQPAITFMLGYRNLYGALAGFPDTGGAAAEANVSQLVQAVSAQARDLGVPACAPG